MKKHWAIFIDNNSDKAYFIDAILNKQHRYGFEQLASKCGMLFSSIALEHFIDEEERHDRKLISRPDQPLKTMSSGEQKKALLFHILDSKPDYVILDNPFDNLDAGFQEQLKQLLEEHSNNTTYIQLASRKVDILPFISKYGRLQERDFHILTDSEIHFENKSKDSFNGTIPPPLSFLKVSSETLVQFKNVSISYNKKPILQDINWKIKKEEFWQLLGKNGSGKTTILSMITGDNPKAYGQEIYLFGKKKGTGESVWDIKQKLGYYSPSMTDSFRGRHTVEHMLISGLNDSIGLYINPTENQKRTIRLWLVLLNLIEKKDVLFKDLSLGQQRLVMTSRAMVKHPPLLILDEPTAGMDDASAKLLVDLVNKIASETSTAIVFVSHRSEPGLLPKKVFQLNMTEKGSIGTSKNL